ncbi:MAG: C4-type zinc ribbon domain-containing protein [Tepidisphaeraceae bacterium]
MGPTNVALVKLFDAERKLREAQGNLDGASRSVRLLERRVKDLTERVGAAQAQVRQNQSRYTQLDLEIKTREAHIEKLRGQQQNAKSHKEYQTFLTEINTGKIDKNKFEDEALGVMGQVEKSQKELADLIAQLDGETKKLDETRDQLSGRLSELQAEIDRLQPDRDAAANALPANAVHMFERLADRHEGEALAAVTRPNRRVEEYSCGACHMGLVVDIYNRLHTRDEIVVCPNCHRILYIPEELPVEAAIIKRERREPRGKDSGIGAITTRQVDAVSIMRSITPESSEAATSTEAQTPAEPVAPPTRAPESGPAA